jgi:RNA polymerase sigma-70 factor (ECF subfamily)
MAGVVVGSMTSPSEEAIQVARAKGDRQAFAPLYLAYFDRVYAYCYRRLGHPEDAADLTSVIFSRALASLGSCRDNAFRSWLFSIAHNALTDQFRTRKAEQPLDRALDVADRGRSPEEEAIQSEASRTVSELLAELVEDQRSVIELRLAGLTSREIGVVLGKQPNAVDQLQFRAMTRLRLLGNRDVSRTEVPR